jgi:molybdopterin molybdotransferase
MISVSEARKRVLNNIRPLPTEWVVLKKALGRVSAQAVFSGVSLPVFDNSAMDGYALRAQDTQTALSTHPVVLKILGKIQAGDPQKRVVGPGEAYGIMTGAPIPQGADVVLIKEKAKVYGDGLSIEEPVSPKENIRFKGEEVRKNWKALAKNTPLSPAAVGLLAMIGKSRVRVFRKVRAGVIATGSELVLPGKRLGHGQVYDTNSFLMAAALEKMGIKPRLVWTTADDAKTLKDKIGRALGVVDVLILTGGVSVGDHDLVKTILKQAGVREIFWKIRQKPGKPLFFGKKNHTLVFGLPGNPASAFVGFYQYVYPALRRLEGLVDCFLPSENVGLAHPLKTDETKTLFLKTRMIFKNGQRKALCMTHQASHMISNLHQAQALAEVPSRRGVLKEGDCVKVSFL